MMKKKRRGYVYCRQTSMAVVVMRLSLSLSLSLFAFVFWLSFSSSDLFIQRQLLSSLTAYLINRFVLLFLAYDLYKRQSFVDAQD